MEKKVREIKSYLIKKGSMKENEWQAIVKSLVADSG
jgi:stalled ribosome alternative rescue factor ArfA